MAATGNPNDAMAKAMGKMSDEQKAKVQLTLGGEYSHLIPTGKIKPFLECIFRADAFDGHCRRHSLSR